MLQPKQADIGTPNVPNQPDAEASRVMQMLASRHPTYDPDLMRRHRLTYSRTDEFIDVYLRKHFEEDPAAWKDRKALAYNPSFAAEAVDEYVRAIVQRSPDVHRVGGMELYREIMDGANKGIDLQGSTMNSFMAKHVIPELLAMGMVGVYVDNDLINGQTLADVGGKHPFCFTYRAEDILNWRYDPANPNELLAVLLRDHVEEIDAFQMTTGVKARYRHVMREGNKIVVRIFDENGKMGPITTQNTEFPFVFSRLGHSLLKITSRIQIALLNLSSSDIYYAWASNFPIYVEQYDQLGFNRLKETRTVDEDKPIPIGPPTDDGFPANLSDLPPGPATGEQQKIKLGTMQARLYPKGAERPGFVHPSSEPLVASMDKEKQLKAEIRQLTALAITQLEPTRQASAEAKQMDNTGLEAGMSFIAQELEGIENKIAVVFHSYFTSRPKPTRVKYPEKYNLKSDEDRREEAEQLKKLHQAVPSRTFADEVSKSIIRVLFKDKVTTEILNKMYKEVEDSPVPTADPETLRSDHEAGLVGDETASLGRGYKAGEHLKAQKDHADRAARIAAAQEPVDPGARGNGDLSNDPDAGKKDKKNSQNGNLDKGGRGKARVGGGNG